MRKLLGIIGLSLMSFSSFSQVNTNTAEQAIQKTIQTFFNAIERQDTTLFKSTLKLDGQVWVQNRTKEPIQITTRFLKEDIHHLQGEHQYLEKALHYDIKVHKGMAMAWVAYEFWRNGAFSHCGIDAFTLMKVNKEWKIVSLSYSVETSDCDELSKQK